MLSIYISGVIVSFIIFLLFTICYDEIITLKDILQFLFVSLICSWILPIILLVSYIIGISERIVLYTKKE